MGMVFESQEILDSMRIPHHPLLGPPLEEEEEVTFTSPLEGEEEVPFTRSPLREKEVPFTSPLEGEEEVPFTSSA
jgi:hypothetical protein